MVKKDRTAPSNLFAGLARSRVLVTLDNSQGFEGILWWADDSGLLIKQAADEPILFYRDGSDEPVPMDRGDVFVPADRLLFIQVLAEGGG